MKKLIFTIYLFFSICTQAQEPVLLETQWILQNIIVNGEDHIPYNTAVDFDLSFNLESNGSHSLFFPAALYMWQANITFATSTSSFTTIGDTWVGLTMGICFDDNTSPCFMISHLLETFYFVDDNMPVSKEFDYELGTTTAGTPILIITDINGDQAIYGTESVLDIPSLHAPRLILYPNPATESLFITSEGEAIESLSVYTVSGKKVMEFTENTSVLDVSALPEGLYFLEMVTATGRDLQKFIKK